MITDAIFNVFLSLLVFIRNLFPMAPDLSAYQAGYREIIGYMALFFDMRLLGMGVNAVVVSLGLFVIIRLIRFIPGMG